MGGKNQTTNSSSSSTYTPTGASQLQDIWDKVQSAASTPYQAYTGQQVAGLDPTQLQGVSNVNSSIGSAQPLFNQAIQYGQQGAAPIDQSAIDRYQSPYTNSVINATQANFNEDNAQQQQQLLGNAAMKGALGGDRSGVAQAELARQQQLAQAPVIAGLQNQGYSQALAAAQQDRSAQAQGAYTFGSLAPAVQNTGIAGGNAQIAAGSVPQQNQQQQLSAQYQNYLQEQAFPYQQAQFLASYGLPAATAQGGTNTGTGSTTQPGPNIFGQLAGLGLAGGVAAGSLGWKPFAKDGGRINGYASGGSPMGVDNFMLTPSFIPQGQVPQSRAPQVPQMQMPQAKTPQAMAMPSAQALQAGLSGLGRAYNDIKLGDDGLGNWNDYSWDGGTPLEGSTPIGQGGIGSRASGGRVNKHDELINSIRSIHQALKDGGAVTSSPFLQGYDGGGSVDDLSFADRASPIQSAIANGIFDPQGGNYTPFTGAPQPSAIDDNPPLPQARPMMADNSPPTLPPQITNPDNTPPPDSPLAYSGDQPSGGLQSPEPSQTSPDAQQPEGKGGLFGTGFLANLSPEAKAGLLSAGLGMMASRSPFALTQIGEGGLQGVQAYTQAKKTTADEALRKQNADLAGQRLAQSAAQFATNSDETKRYHDILDQQRKDALNDKLTRSGYVKNIDGTMTPIQGGPADPTQIAAVAKAKLTGSSLPDDTADFLAERILAGDSKALVGLGRGAQGPENITRVQTLVARKAAERNIDAQDILQKVAEASGLNAQQRTFGTQTAKMAVNSTEAQGAIKLGREASANVPRGNWVPVTKVIQAYQSGTSDPMLAKFGAANLAIVNTYARAINPTGVPHAADKEHAMAMLSTATGPEAYNAVLDQMDKEIEIAHSAAPKAKQELEDIRKGKKTTGEIQPTVPATISSKAQYDALPSNSEFVGSDGKKYRKP